MSTLYVNPRDKNCACVDVSKISAIGKLNGYHFNVFVDGSVLYYECRSSYDAEKSRNEILAMWTAHKNKNSH